MAESAPPTIPRWAVWCSRNRFRRHYCLIFCSLVKQIICVIHWELLHCVTCSPCLCISSGFGRAIFLTSIWVLMLSSSLTMRHLLSQSFPELRGFFTFKDLNTFTLSPLVSYHLPSKRMGSYNHARIRLGSLPDKQGTRHMNNKGTSGIKS